MIFNEIFYENNQPTNDILFVRQAGELLYDASYTISRSGSRTHSIGILHSGKLHLESEGNKITIIGKQCVFLPEKISYSISADVAEPPHFLWMNLRGKLISSLSETLFGRKCVISNANVAEVMPRIRELLSDSHDRFHEISMLIFDVLLKMSESASSENIEEDKRSEYEIYISNSIQGGFSVKAMAEHFHISEDTLCRRFKTEYGVTPYKYYLAMRIEIAKSMLKKTELTIDDISTRLHFSDRNHFTLCFKEFVGCSPAQYQKKPER